MSSPANGPFQSRLFNFLNRQNHRIKEQYHRTVRQVKVAAVWGVQIALYPIYLLVQMGRVTGNQVQQAVKRGQLNAATNPQPEPPPPADKPIQQVIGAVEREQVNLLTSVEESGIDLTQVPSLAVCGIASLLSTRNLVLVTTENQIVDILTPQQQQKIIQRIAWELADYWYRWRVAKAFDNKPTKRLPIVPQENKQVLAPVRLFWRVMAWVQTSPVAIATNLFQESSLVPIHVSEGILVTSNLSLESLNSETITPTLPQLPSSNLIHLPAVEQSLTLLDRTVAGLETQPLQTFSEITTGIIQRTQGLLQRSQAKEAQPIDVATPSELPATANPEITHPWRIQLLIQAAIDYFFGQHQGEASLNYQAKERSPHALSGKASKRQNRLSGNPTLTEEEDPWLTWGDLFPDETTPVTPNGVDIAYEQPALSSLAELNGDNSVLPSLPGQPDIPINRSIFSRLQRYITPRQGALKRLEKNTSSALAETQPTPHAVSKFSQTETTGKIKPKPTPQRKISRVNQSKTKLSKNTVPSAPLDHTPDWIETPATPSGYVKHPLEQILELLDRFMVWLEDVLIKIWRRVFKRRNKPQRHKEHEERD